MALRPDANAMQQDIAFVGHAHVIAQYHLKAVTQCNAQMFSVRVYCNGCNGEQPVSRYVESAGLHIQHHPARVINALCGTQSSGQCLQQVHRR